MNSKKIRIFGPHSQEGAALVIAVLILLILTVIGVYAVTTSTMDTKITGYQKVHVEAFYAADAGLDYALANYSSAYATLVEPGDTWPYEHHDPECNITVRYLCKTPPPVGSGTGTRQGFVAHHYRTDSNGEAGVAKSTVHMWGYRIGY